MKSYFVEIIFREYQTIFYFSFAYFLKRRFNIKSGQPFWIMDQLDFAIFAILFATLPILFAPELFLAPDINIIIFLLILTPSVSVIANTVAYFLGLKEVPW